MGYSFAVARGLKLMARTAANPNFRYLAFTSDVGEAARPVVPPSVVKAAYGMSIAYIFMDIAHEAWKAKGEGMDSHMIQGVVVERTLFQGLASLFFPMLTIHTAVAKSQVLFTKHAPKLVR